MQAGQVRNSLATNMISSEPQVLIVTTDAHKSVCFTDLAVPNALALFLIPCGGFDLGENVRRKSR